MAYLLGMDIGTSSTRAIIIDEDGRHTTWMGTEGLGNYINNASAGVQADFTSTKRATDTQREFTCRVPRSTRYDKAYACYAI